MRVSIKKSLLAVTLFLFLLSSACLVLTTTSAKKANAEGISFSMMTGAEIRLDADNSGIKYRACIGQSVQSTGRYYMMIIPSALFDAVITANSIGYSDYATADWYQLMQTYATARGGKIVSMIAVPYQGYRADESADCYYIRGSLTNILYNNINSRWMGIAYYQSESGTRTYTSDLNSISSAEDAEAFNAKVRRSIPYVASRAINVEEDEDNTVILDTLLTQSVNKSNGVAAENKNNAITVSVPASTFTVYEGGTSQLILNGLSDNSDIEYKWNSSDTSVATVSDGAVTAVNVGSSTVSCKVFGNTYNYTCNVPSEGVSFTEMQTEPAFVDHYYGNSAASKTWYQYYDGHYGVSAFGLNSLIDGENSGAVSLTDISKNTAGYLKLNIRLKVDKSICKSITIFDSLIGWQGAPYNYALGYGLRLSEIPSNTWTTVSFYITNYSVSPTNAHFNVYVEGYAAEEFLWIDQVYITEDEDIYSDSVLYSDMQTYGRTPYGWVGYGNDDATVSWLEYYGEDKGVLEMGLSTANSNGCLVGIAPEIEISASKLLSIRLKIDKSKCTGISLFNGYDTSKMYGVPLDTIEDNVWTVLNVHVSSITSGSTANNISLFIGGNAAGSFIWIDRIYYSDHTISELPIPSGAKLLSDFSTAPNVWTAWDGWWAYINSASASRIDNIDGRRDVEILTMLYDGQCCNIRGILGSTDVTGYTKITMRVKAISKHFNQMAIFDDNTGKAVWIHGNNPEEIVMDKWTEITFNISDMCTRSDLSVFELHIRLHGDGLKAGPALYIDQIYAHN